MPGHATQLRHRAFLTADAVLGLAVVIILTATLAVAVTKQSRASQRLAETRAAARLAEATLIALQTGQKPPAPPDGAVVRAQTVHSLGGLPPGCFWTTVTVTLNGRSTDLTGIVRVDDGKGAFP